MSKEEYPYPEDEFDTLGAGRVPQGVHREPPPRWRLWLPYVLVLVLVPLLTFGAVKFFAGDSAPEPTPTATETPDAAPEEPEGDGDPTPEDAEDATAEPGAENGEPEGEEPGEEATEGEEPGEGELGEGDETADAEPDYGTSVLVLNGAGVQGLAGDVAGALESDGWTNTEADNYTSEIPAQTALYYTSEEFVTEAQAVAAALGITNVIESASGASNGVVIVLRTDFSMPTGQSAPTGP